MTRFKTSRIANNGAEGGSLMIPSVRQLRIPSVMPSTTHQQTIQESLAELETRSQRVNPARAFERYLWTNPETCNECFARLREIDEVELDDWGNVAQLIELTDDAVRGWDDDATGVFHPATFCNECGSRGCAHPETDTKTQATRRAYRIAERLREQDIPVAVDVLLTATRQLKSDERIQGFDREIYARATKLAISRGLTDEH